MELDGIKDSMRRELSTHKGKLGEAENKLQRKDTALQQAQATLREREETLQRKGGSVVRGIWCCVCVLMLIGGGYWWRRVGSESHVDPYLHTLHLCMGTGTQTRS